MDPTGRVELLLAKKVALGRLLGKDAREAERRWRETTGVALPPESLPSIVSELQKPLRDREREKFRPPRRRRRRRERFHGFVRDRAGYLRRKVEPEQLEYSGKSWGSLSPLERLELFRTDRDLFERMGDQWRTARPAPVRAPDVEMAERLKLLADAVLNGTAKPLDLSQLQAAYAAAFGEPETEWARAYVAALLALQQLPPARHAAGLAVGMGDLCIAAFGSPPIFPGYPNFPWHADLPAVRQWVFEHLTPAERGGGGRLNARAMTELIQNPHDLGKRMLESDDPDQKATAVSLVSLAPVAKPDG